MADLKERGPRAQQRLNLGQISDSQLSLRVARSRQEMEEAYKLCFEAYAQKGYTSRVEEALGMRFSIYNALPTTLTLIAQDEGKVVGTLTHIVYSSLGLPTGKIFDLQHLLRRSPYLCEASALAVADSHQGHGGHVLFHLIRNYFALCEESQALDQLIISINPSHKSFYENILLFDRLAEGCLKNDYDFVCGAPALGMQMPLGELRGRVHQKYAHLPKKENLFHFLFGGTLYSERPFVQDGSASPLVIDTPTMTPEDLYHFFAQLRSDLVLSLKEQHQYFIRSSYNFQNYQSVFDELGLLKPKLRRQLHRFTTNIPIFFLLTGQITQVRNASRSHLAVKRTKRLDDFPHSGFTRAFIDLGSRGPVELNLKLTQSTERDLVFEIKNHSSAWEAFMDKTEAMYLPSKREGLYNLKVA